MRGALILALLATAAPALAENAIEPAEERDGQEIIVTGQRETAGGQVATSGRVGILGDQEAIDTPFSVRSLTDEFVRNQQAQSITKVIESDPSIFSPGASNRSATWSDSFFVRGFNTGTSDTIGINGLYGLLFETPPIEPVARLDILKGPSAFLNGSPSAVGGSFNIQPKRAEDAPTRRLTAEYLSDAVFGGSADLGQRFDGGRFGARINGAYRGGDLVFDDATRDDGGASAAVDFRGESVQVAADVLYNRTLNEGYQFRVRLGPTYPLDAPFLRPINGRRRTQPSWFSAGAETITALARIDWDFAPGWSLSTAYGHAYNDRGFDAFCDLTVTNVAGVSDCVVSGSFTRVRADSADAVITGSFRTGPINHRLVIGGNLLLREQLGTGGIPVASFTVANGQAFNYYNSADRPAPVPLPPRPAFLLTTDRAIESVFIGDTLSLDDDLITLTVGARRTRVKLDSFARTGALTSALDDSKTTPAIAGTIQPTDWLTFYANYVEALEPGGIAPANAGNAGEAFPPLVTDQIEGGIKAKLGPLFVTAAAFRINKANQFLDMRTTPPLFVQSGLQRNEGVELSLAGSPIEGLNVILGAAWIDATQLNTAGGLFDGKDAPGVPEFSGRIYVDYELPFAPGLSLSGTVFHGGDTAYDNLNTRFLPSYTRFDVGARYAFSVGETDFVARVLAENVDDNRYYIGSGNFVFVGPPRTIAVSLSADF